MTNKTYDIRNDLLRPCGDLGTAVWRADRWNHHGG